MYRFDLDQRCNPLETEQGLTRPSQDAQDQDGAASVSTIMISGFSASRQSQERTSILHGYGRPATVFIHILPPKQ
jgi:hypothetical protein